MNAATPDQLKSILRGTVAEVKQLRALVTKLCRTIDERNQERVPYIDHIAILEKIIFKKGRERLQSTTAESTSDLPRSTEAKDLTLHSQNLAPPPKPKVVATLPEDVVIHGATDAELIEEARIRGYESAAASDWQEIVGLYDRSTEITVVERTYKRLVHQRKKYRFLPSVGTEKEIIVAAQGAEKLLEGGSYSVDFALAVVADKYQFHLPLNRQIQKMSLAGLKGMDPKTLYNLCLAVATHLDPVVGGIRADILAANLAAHLDETPWRILSKSDSNGYMWTLSNQAGSIYRFEPSRSGKVAEEMLGDFNVPIICDGYSGYERFKKVANAVLAYCWSHARRKFVEIQQNYPKECTEIIGLMNELFAIEREAKNWDALKELRGTKSAAVTAKIHAWLIEKQTLHLKASGFSKAIKYSLKRWAGLTAFLSDVRIPLSNNDAERSLRHAVLGRKNYNGSKTINGADTAATLFTVIESCKRVKLEPALYMRYVIRCNNTGVTALTPLGYAKEIRKITAAAA